MNPSTPAPEVIVALDVEEKTQALRLVETLAPAIRYFKLGSRLFTAEGPGMIGEIARRGGSVFLDLKFHDIPATVAGSVRAACRPGVRMMTIHASGGAAMMGAAAAAAREEAERLGIPRPLLVGVTVLTSLSAEDLASTAPAGASIRDLVLVLARRAWEAGLDGVVASVEEAAAIRTAAGPGFVIVTPGIRPAGAEALDQKRVATPAAARRAGASYLVVGRPIIEMADPLEAAREILAEVEGSR